MAVSARIRPGTHADLDRVLACDPYAESSEPRRQVIAAALAAGTLLLAEEGVATVGLAIVDHSFFGMGFVSLVAVAPAARRRGVALRLLEAAERSCRSPRLFISTNASNTVAQALFRRAGFAPSGRIDNLDPGDPELVFFKPVAA